MKKLKTKEQEVVIPPSVPDDPKFSGTEIVVRDSQTPVNPKPGQPGNPGKPLGARNKKTLEALAAVEKIRASGSTPLEVMWEIANTNLNDEKLTLKQRDNILAKFRMMSEIAPYVHPRLTAIAIKDESTLNKKSHEQMLLMLDHPPQASQDDVERLDESMEVFERLPPYDEELDDG